MASVIQQACAIHRRLPANSAIEGRGRRIAATVCAIAVKTLRHARRIVRVPVRLPVPVIIIFWMPEKHAIISTWARRHAQAWAFTVGAFPVTLPAPDSIRLNARPVPAVTGLFNARSSANRHHSVQEPNYRMGHVRSRAVQAVHAGAR